MSAPITIGIDVGSYTTRVMVVQFTKEENKIVPAILGIGKSETKGVRRGYIINMQEAIESIEKALHDAEKTSGVKIRRAHISIGGISLCSHEGHGSIPVTKADGIITRMDLDRVLKECEKNINLSNHSIIETIPLEYAIDSNRVRGRAEGMKGKKLSAKALFITSLTQHLDDLIHAINQSGIDVIDVVAAPISESLVVTNERQRNAGCAVVNIGAETTSIAVFENNTIISLHVFAVGSSEITNDIALGLQIPLQEAESVKIGSTAPDAPRRKVDTIVDARIVEIFELIETHLKSIKRDELLPGGIILTGGGSYLSQIELAAKKTLRLPITVGAQVNGLGAKISNLSDSSWFVAYGLCVLGRISGDGIVSKNPLKKILVDIKKMFSNLFKQLTP